jgi:hypothetical protein
MRHWPHANSAAAGATGPDRESIPDIRGGLLCGRSNLELLQPLSPNRYRVIPPVWIGPTRTESSAAFPARRAKLIKKRHRRRSGFRCGSVDARCTVERGAMRPTITRSDDGLTAERISSPSASASSCALCRLSYISALVPKNASSRHAVSAVMARRSRTISLMRGVSKRSALARAFAKSLLAFRNSRS